MVESNLLSVLTEFHIDHITSAAKEAGRAMFAIRGGPRTPQEEIELLDYCQTDVPPLVELYGLFVGQGNIHQAIARGRYMKSVTLMRAIGTPVDVPRLQEFRDKWESIKWQLVSEVDSQFGVFDGLKFSNEQFKYLTLPTAGSIGL